MKKNYFLILTLFISGLSFGQTVVFQESFETGNTGTPSETCNDGYDFFTRTDGSDLGSNYQVNGQDGDWFFAAMDTDGSPCSLNPETLFFDDIDISSYNNLTLAILLAEDKDGTNYDWDYDSRFYIEIDVDNSGSFTKVLQVAVSDSSTGSNISQPMIDTDLDGDGDGAEITDVFTEYTANITSGNLVDIRLVFENLLAGDEDISVDNIRIINDFVNNPSLAITSPSNNNTFSPETSDVSTTVIVNNFTLSADDGSGSSDGSGDGYIKSTLTETGEADQEEIFFSTTLADIAVVAGKDYSLTMELVDNSGASLSPAVSSAVNFSIASYTQAATIADVRAGTEGNYYELTGEVVITYDAGNSRNQKYIQDASGAILIDDSDDVITTAYNVGDGITGIKGKLGSYGGVLQFIPEVDPGTASSTGNTITSEVVTIAELTANFENYESEWITINDVTFSDADGSATFVSGQNYDITDGTNTLVFRTAFSNADIIGEVIPSSSADITGPASEFNGTAQIFGTSLANISLGVASNTINGFNVYPNPVKGNSLTVTTSSTEAKTVNIFNVLGRKVFSQRFSSMNKIMDISGISSGVYIMKGSEGDNISTKKLIID